MNTKLPFNIAKINTNYLKLKSLTSIAFGFARIDEQFPSGVVRGFNTSETLAAQALPAIGLGKGSAQP